MINKQKLLANVGCFSWAHWRTQREGRPWRPQTAMQQSRATGRRQVDGWDVRAAKVAWEARDGGKECRRQQTNRALSLLMRGLAGDGVPLFPSLNILSSVHRWNWIDPAAASNPLLSLLSIRVENLPLMKQHACLSQKNLDIFPHYYLKT